ncbi:hypothetical protein FQZ97_1142410 [compost metagenome]
MFVSELIIEHRCEKVDTFRKCGFVINGIQFLTANPDLAVILERLFVFFAGFQLMRLACEFCCCSLCQMGLLLQLESRVFPVFIERFRYRDQALTAFSSRI